MTFKFACPKCQKSIKASSEVAGKTAKCPTCGVKLKIPNPKPALAGAARARGSKPASKAKVSAPAPAANDGMLPFDDDEWDNALTNPFEAPKAEDEPQKIHSHSDPKKVTAKELRWTKLGLQLLNGGLNGLVLCWIVGFVMGLLGLAGGEESNTLQAVLLGFQMLFFLLMVLAPYFCISVPEKTGAKQMALVSATAQTLVGVLWIALLVSIGSSAASGKVDPTSIMAIGFLLFAASITAYFAFVNFLKKLATFIGRDDIAGSASTVMMLGVVEGLMIALAVVLPGVAAATEGMAWLVIVSGVALVAAGIGGLIAFGMYANAVHKLAAALPSVKKQRRS